MPLVIPSKRPDTLVATLAAVMEAPYAIFRGRGRTHIPFILTGVVYTARRFASGNFNGFGQDTTNVTAQGVGYDQKVNEQGLGLFELGKRVIARSGSVKEPVYWEGGKQLDMQKEFTKNPDFEAQLIPIPLNDNLIEGPGMKASWGSDKNVAKQKRSAADGLALSANSNFPMKANKWVDQATGKLIAGDDKVDWNMVTGIQSKLGDILKHHRDFEGTEEHAKIMEMITYIPFATDSKHALALAEQTPVAAAAANAAEDPFAGTATASATAS